MNTTLPHELPEKTEPSFRPTFNPKVFGLLVEEEQARKELSANIDTMLTRSLSQPVEQLLLAVKDYLIGIKELGDLLKQ